MKLYYRCNFLENFTQSVDFELDNKDNDINKDVKIDKINYLIIIGKLADNNKPINNVLVDVFRITYRKDKSIPIYLDRTYTTEDGYFSFNIPIIPQNISIMFIIKDSEGNLYEYTTHIEKCEVI